VAPPKLTQPSGNFSELGRTGLFEHSGYIREEFLRELSGTRWNRVVREMLANDPVINAMFFVIEMLVRQVEWEVEPASDANEDQQTAEFFKECLFQDMSTSWAESLAEILSFLPWGWAYHEVVYKRRGGESRDPAINSRFTDGRIGWRKWPIRAQESRERWLLDDNGGIQALIQRPAPQYREIIVPIEKSLLFRTTSHKNNPEGKSLLRACYRPWYFRQKVENFEGIGIERDLAGLPLMAIPAQYLSENASPSEQALATYCKELVTAVRNDEQAGLLIPSDVYPETSIPQFSFNLAGTGSRRLFDTDKVIARKNQEILMRLLADFIILGHEQVGSFALSSNKTNMFGTALGAWLESISEVINRYAIPRLGKLNGMPAESMPKLKHQDIESIDLGELGEFIKNLSGAGVRITPDMAAFAVEQAKMPVPDDHNELIGEVQEESEDDEET